jgi:hypothetical protein
MVIHTAIQFPWDSIMEEGRDMQEITFYLRLWGESGSNRRPDGL